MPFINTIRALLHKRVSPKMNTMNVTDILV